MPGDLWKIAGIKLCQAYHKQYGSNFISAMPTNLYGPNDNFDLESSHVLPALIRKFHLAKLAAQGAWEALQRDEALFGPIPPDLKDSFAIPNNFAPQGGSLDPASSSSIPSSAIGHPSSGLFPSSAVRHPSSVLIWGTGTARREFLHVDDLADACLVIMEKWEDPEHINVGAGKDLTIRELVEIVREIVFPEARIVFDSSKPDGTPQKLLDISRLEDLGWSPAINFKEGIRDTYTWYLEQTK